jgi:hypothetical protein
MIELGSLGGNNNTGHSAPGATLNANPPPPVLETTRRTLLGKLVFGGCYGSFEELGVPGVNGVAAGLVEGRVFKPS